MDTNHCEIPLNQHLLLSITKWQEDGSKQQEGISWNSTYGNWINGFPKYGNFFHSLPKIIDRQVVREICSSDTYSVIEKFLATMVWGYSDRGYGAHRVSKMLSQGHAEETLRNVLELSRGASPIEAYEYFAQNRILHLGPSYGSKFITFNTPREASAPILDSLILLWLKEFAAADFSKINLGSLTWNTKTYTAFSNWIQKHATFKSCFPDEVELVLFRLAEERYAKSSVWVGK